MVAQGWNEDAIGFGGVKDRHSCFGFHRDSVDRQ
jgi:hypothetical protein